MSLPPGGVDRLRMATPADERSSCRPSRKCHARARPRRGQGREPASRVERSESLDDAEASARISGVMADRPATRSGLESRPRADVPALNDHATKRVVVRVFLAACPEGDVLEGLRVVWITEVS